MLSSEKSHDVGLDGSLLSSMVNVDEHIIIPIQVRQVSLHSVHKVAYNGLIQVLLMVHGTGHVSDMVQALRL